MDIRQITAKRKKWVEANRENNFEDGIKRLLTDLYPDNAHFIYELLQNAEDALATEVRFFLYEDRVEFEHNGKRLFDIKDVESITSIGASNKKDDPTNIGKFGVGFKAVFAYTTTPEILSGAYHFRIHDLVVPETDGLSPDPSKKKETRFVFPFNNPSKPPEKARDEIEKNLRQFDESTLLFLKNIYKIEYRLSDSGMGFLERAEQKGNRIAIDVQRPGESESKTIRFLYFEKQVEVTDEEEKLETCRIAVAYGLEMLKEESKGQDDLLDGEEEGEEEGRTKNPAPKKGNIPLIQWRIRPLNPGRVSIYFPAEKETSNLRFHLHAPFASTVARDSVRDCPENDELRDHLAHLVVESMTAIRDQGLLTVGFLSTLPNERDNLSNFYEPIMTAIVEAFKNEELTPMKQGGHAAARGIYRGPAQLSNLITDDDLAKILGEDYFPPMWVANPPQRNQREDNFLSMLDIGDWEVKDLLQHLTERHNTIYDVISDKPDAWHQRLYAILEDYLSSYGDYSIKRCYGDLTRLPIIRLQKGGYSIGSNCYFTGEKNDYDEVMARVAKEVYSSGRSGEQKQKARKFLSRLGVREVGEVEQIEVLLKTRYSDEAVKRKEFKPDLKDMKRFVRIASKDSSCIPMFKDYHIFFLEGDKWGKPSQVYLDKPYIDTCLSAYFEAIPFNRTRFALSHKYHDLDVSDEKIGAFAKLVGALTELPIEKRSTNDHSDSQHLRQDYNKPRIRWTHTAIDEDWHIPHLDFVICDKSLEFSLLLWKIMRNAPKTIFYARFRPNQDYPTRTLPSSMVLDLCNYTWVPQRGGDFVKPADAQKDLLPKGFDFDEKQEWLKIIHFGENIIKKSNAYQELNEQIQKLGFESLDQAKQMAEVAKLWTREGKGLEDLIAELSPREKPEFPSRDIVNSDRRSESLNGQIGDAPDKSFEPRKRRVRTSRGNIDPSVWLRQHYTNDDHQMVCQRCKGEMPFKKPDGEYYFEAVEALSKEYFSKEHEAQFLALCPLCAAMYKVFVKDNGNDSTMKELVAEIVNAEELEVPLILGDLETSIQFVDAHLHDMRQILLTRG